MSKTIILVRHSFAENGSFKTKDFDRELTAQGIQFAKLQSIKLSESFLNVDFIVSSDAKRAIQTAEILNEKINATNGVSREHFLYSDYTTQEFINYIHALANDLNSILIVGHNPTLANVANRLSDDFNESVSPGTILIIEFKCDNWKDVEVNTGCIIEIIA